MKLPLLLSGPILRRSNTKSIVIWLATSIPLNIKGTLYKLNRKNEQTERLTDHDNSNDDWNYQELEIRTRTKSVQLGNHLIVHLVELIPRFGMFPTDCFLGYNLTFVFNKTQMTLEDLGLLSPDHPDSITYKPFKYPTFVLNKKVPTNILYGSCRKFHGKGPDQLPKADKLIALNPTDLAERPHTLFLMGDQIYADDVGGPIRLFLTKIGNWLLGNKNEQLAKLDSRLNFSPFPQALEQINGRQFIMEEFAQFTSTHAANHLITFAEFSAMYLMNWSPVLWSLLESEGDLPTFNQLLDQGRFYTIYPKDDTTFKKDLKKELKKARKRYEEELKELYSFRKGLTKVRRLMANLPTYMIFDDHDVTDDWNLSHKWRENVYRSPLGKHIVANGLSAYWAFQGWGNAPEEFNSNFTQSIESYLSELDVSSEAHKKWAEQMWRFSNWAFVAPTEPKALFLDTRTMRGYDPIPEPVQIGLYTKEAPMSSELIGSKGWELTESILLGSGWNKQTPLLIISATPLYGIQLIENFVIKHIYPLRSLGIPVDLSFDIEAWKDNGKAFTKFLKKLDEWDPNPCFILSGDVHYAFEAESHIKFPKNSKPRVYFQLTSSPIKNESFSGLVGYILRYATRLRSPTKHRKEIDHYCNDHYRLLAEKQLINDPTTVNWHEKIFYQPNSYGQVIETTNNIGFLKVNPSMPNWSNILLK